MNLEDLNVHGWGSLAFHFVGTYQISNKTTTLPGQPTFDCAGLFGPICDDGRPDVASHLLGDLGHAVEHHGAAAVALHRPVEPRQQLDRRPPCSNSSSALPIRSTRTWRAINYLDLSAAWRVNTILTVRAGVNNLLDQDPPLMDQNIAGTGEPNAYPTYDLLGRQLFISATAKF